MKNTNLGIGAVDRMSVPNSTNLENNGLGRVDRASRPNVEVDDSKRLDRTNMTQGVSSQNVRVNTTTQTPVDPDDGGDGGDD